MSDVLTKHHAHSNARIQFHGKNTQLRLKPKVKIQLRMQFLITLAKINTLHY